MSYPGLLIGDVIMPKRPPKCGLSAQDDWLTVLLIVVLALTLVAALVTLTVHASAIG